jgi:hypothetical protein
VQGIGSSADVSVALGSQGLFRAGAKVRNPRISATRATGWFWRDSSRWCSWRWVSGGLGRLDGGFRSSPACSRADWRDAVNAPDHVVACLPSVPANCPNAYFFFGAAGGIGGRVCCAGGLTFACLWLSRGARGGCGIGRLLGLFIVDFLRFGELYGRYFRRCWRRCRSACIRRRGGGFAWRVMRKR